MTYQATGYCGWDIGGAHLKVARCDHHGQLQTVQQYPCALWRGIDELTNTVQRVINELSCENDVHAITMTGELVDAFSNRQQGVEAIVDCVSQWLPASLTHVFAGDRGWLTFAQAKTEWQAVASMNWQASAMLAAHHVGNGLFVDIGSTTCDVVPFQQQQIRPRGYSDHERQRDGGLVYTGAIRTPLMAIAHQAPLHGDFVKLAAEWFASSADIWCLLDELSDTQIQDNSADGQPWQKPYCRQRLARMLGTDADAATDNEWQLVAHWFADQQLQTIAESCFQVLSATPLSPDNPLVGAGVGRFIARACAQRLKRPYLDFSELCQNNATAADHAPATALALLAKQQLS
jgi:probable H4MPT-linked C1 transfer pathway protein